MTETLAPASPLAALLDEVRVEVDATYMPDRNRRQIDAALDQLDAAIKAQPATGPRGITWHRETVESWAGYAMTDDEVDRLAEAIPFSSVPEAVAAITDHMEPRLVAAVAEDDSEDEDEPDHEARFDDGHEGTYRCAVCKEPITFRGPTAEDYDHV